jgi:lipopolysaccharide/colanic/teichoic acid biosynthesis glycosyltransferase
MAAALKLEHDLCYIERHCLALDVRIVLATLRVVVRADGKS